MAVSRFVSSRARWGREQVAGWWANLKSVVGAAHPRENLPAPKWEWVIGIKDWLVIQTMRSLGFGTPAQQITASITLAVTMIVVSIGALTPAAAIMALPLFMGLLRLWPAVDEHYPISDDRPYPPGGGR